MYVQLSLQHGGVEQPKAQRLSGRTVAGMGGLRIFLTPVPINSWSPATLISAHPGPLAAGIKLSTRAQ
ncbi:MAG: hypothetical protein A2Z88_09680 [Omnitrophica WOR_2 bacterium GWA2_47_8]|nr:MAG: hypothetical protein A2Z88_09680 [Omnitrophica WOR_2 bacterium GWA2_47_8]